MSTPPLQDSEVGMYSWADAVSAGCLSTLFFISAYKKISDRRSIVLWMTGKTRVSQKGSTGLLAALIALDLSLGGAALLWGPLSRWVLLALGVTLFAMLLAGRLLFSRTGCPCFGVASMVDERTNVSMVATFLGMSGLVAGIGEMGFTTSCLTLVSAVLILCGFGAGMNLSKSAYVGVRASDVTDMLPNIDDLDTEGKGVVLVFVSLKCPICMVFLRYLEKVSALLPGTFNIFVFADGMELDEPRRFGGGFICNGRPDLRHVLNIRLSPALVVASKGHSIRYSGIDGCNLGIGKMLVQTFAGSAKR
ncbi:MULTISPECIES: hypothetical protein [Rhodanobacter]|nr:hypothetical protein [Rhodanobacter spathiphylli]